MAPILYISYTFTNIRSHNSVHYARDRRGFYILLLFFRTRSLANWPPSLWIFISFIRRILFDYYYTTIIRGNIGTKTNGTHTIIVIVIFIIRMWRIHYYTCNNMRASPQQLLIIIMSRKRACARRLNARRKCDSNSRIITLLYACFKNDFSRRTRGTAHARTPLSGL